MSTADRVDDLQARRAARAEGRAALEERRQYGLTARHAAKLAYLATRKATIEEEMRLAEPDNSPTPATPAEAA